MHLLYLDDSGSAENKNEAYFVLGGVCVPERNMRWLPMKSKNCSGVKCR